MVAATNDSINMSDETKIVINCAFERLESNPLHLSGRIISNKVMDACTKEILVEQIMVFCGLLNGYALPFDPYKNEELDEWQTVHKVAFEATLTYLQSRTNSFKTSLKNILTYHANAYANLSLEHAGKVSRGDQKLQQALDESSRLKKELSERSDSLRQCEAKVHQLEDTLAKLQATSKKTPNNDGQTSSFNFDDMMSSLQTRSHGPPQTFSSDKPYTIDGLKKFGGNPSENVEDWIFLLDTSFQFHNTPFEKKMGVVLSCVRGNALSHLQSLMKESAFVNWETVKERFRKVFSSQDEQRRLKVSLIELGSTCSDYLTYRNKFISLKARVTGLTKDDVKFFFINGLPGKMKAEVLMKKPESYEKALEYANWAYECELIASKTNPTVNYTGFRYGKKSYDNKSGSIHKQRNGGNNQQHKKGYTKNQNGNKIGKYNQSRPNDDGKRPYQAGNSNTNNSGRSNMKCHNCGSGRHLVKNCRVQRQDRPKVNVADSTELKPTREEQPQIAQRSVANMVNVVRTSDIVEHRIVDYGYVCTASQSPNKLILVDGLVDGNRAKLCVDTGANVSIMAMDYAKAHEITITGHSSEVELANNSIVTVVGRTNAIPVVIMDREHLVEFLVFDKLSQDILLGLDYLIATNAYVIPAKRCLAFEDQISVREAESDEEDQLMVNMVDAYPENDESDAMSQLWEETVDTSLVPAAKLTLEESIQFECVKKNIKEREALSIRDLDICSVGKMTIRVEDVAPIYIPPYRKKLERTADD